MPAGARNQIKDKPEGQVLCRGPLLLQHLLGPASHSSPETRTLRDKNPLNDS